MGQLPWGSGAGLPEPQQAVPKPKDASTAPPTAVHTSLSVCRLEMGLAIIRLVFDGRPVLPDGCVASYYPEMNPLMALSNHDKQSKTPAAKSVPVRIRA